MADNTQGNVRQEYIKTGLMIIKFLNGGLSYNNVKNEVAKTPFPTSYVDGIISLEHHMMFYRTKNLPDSEILKNVTAEGWPKEIVEELLKNIDKRLNKDKY